MEIKSFLNHLNKDNNKFDNIKELPLIFSNRLLNILKKINSKISSELIDLTNSDKNFQFSFVDLVLDPNEVEYVSVIQANRVNRIDGIIEDDLVSPSETSVVWGEKFRQPMRIGSFVARLLPKYAGTKEIENFVNEFKGLLNTDKYEIRLVRGEEIRKWYHVKNYYNPNPEIEDRPEGDEDDPRTTLMKSCLKSPEKQSFFDIYCDNPKQIGMLIMLNKDNKLLARAIIWFGCVIIDKDPIIGVLMDRIYYTNDSDVNVFINYAKEQGWWYKDSQSKEVYTYVVNGEICKKPISIRLENKGMYDKYPYIDTMCFYTPETGRLSSSRGLPVKSRITGKIMDRYELHRANGGVKKLSPNK